MASRSRLLDTVSQELARPEPPWRRSRQPRDRKVAPAKAKATEVRGPAGKRTFGVRCRIDTKVELEYYRHGGILPYVLRQLAT